MGSLNVSRRFFIGGLASFAALGPRRIFAAVPGSFTYGTPELSVGVLSDVHVCLAKGGRKLKNSYDTTHLEKAFAWFRDNGADAVVIAGDMAHSGLVGELKAVADAWNKVFPGDTAPDGRHVERVFVFGNHDWSSPSRAKAVFADEAELKANYLSVDPKKHWDAVFHEEWSPFFTRKVKGYDFVGCHWTNGGCNGTREAFTKGLVDYYAKIGGTLDPKKPFFHVQHPHPRGTVHGEVWGQDDGESVKALSARPNAVAFSGHSHSSLVDERAIWQGAFTSVGTATLRDVGAGGLVCGVDAGFENFSTPKTRKDLDALKTMAAFNRMEGKQGQFVRVYSDRIVFSRRDFVNDAALTDDQVMPLPAAESKPFAFESRRAAAKAPRFAEDAALTFATAEAKGRGAKKGAKAKPCVVISIPPANAEPSARCVRYMITAKGADGAKAEFAILHEGFRFATTDKRTNAVAKCRLALDRLPAGEVSFEVRAYSCWDKASDPLMGKFHVS